MSLESLTKVTLDGAVVYHGSNLDVLPFMADNSVDSIVTDPPYELGFMGKTWDSSGIAYSVELWSECLRVLKPGGHLLAFGGSRTWHRLAVAIEDAGFDMRDSIAWLYGSGFPKSHNVALGIDKMLGHKNRGRAIPVASTFQASDVNQENKLTSNPVDAYTARSAEAEAWQGWGTALKPAFEPVVVARKPLVGTVAENVLAWGVGGLNIDASRIGTEERFNAHAGNKDSGFTTGDDRTDAGKGLFAGNSDGGSTVQGRWPANIILDEYTASLLDEQSGEGKSVKSNRGVGYNDSGVFGTGNTDFDSKRGYADSGGASRFFYVSKANKRDRNEGLDELPKQLARKFAQDETTLATMPFGKEPVQNFHPTVKPTDLMRYLIKLVTPPDGIVLDPFTGSGSTGKAALLDGYRFIGVELTEEYLPVIEGRLQWAIDKVSADKKDAEIQAKEALF